MLHDAYHRCIAWAVIGFNLIGTSNAQAIACSDLKHDVDEVSSLTIKSSSQVGSESLSFPRVKPLTNQIPLCRVQGTVGYSLNKSIGVEVWLPSSDDWNGRYIVVGMT